VSDGKLVDMSADLSGMSLWLAGEAGQVSLAASAGAYGARAAVDQHAAEIRDALGERLGVDVLLGYAQGFVEAAVARGWWPPHRRTAPGPDHAGPGPGMAGCEPPRLDWESLRLAAVCRLVLEARGLGL